MQGTALLDSFLGSAPSRRAAGSAPAAGVFFPREHGSWSLVIEPLALGLVIAPSWAGGALTAAVLAVFFARRPFKAVSTSTATRRREAWAAVALFAVLGISGLSIVLVLRGATSLWPLLPAAPLAGLFAWFDTQNGARAGAAETAGSAAFALVPAALATLAGWPAWSALALAAVALTRSVPTVLAVRACLRRAKGGTGGFLLPVFVAAGAALALTALAASHRLPAGAAVPAWGLFARTLWFADSARPAWPARRIGQLEALLGLAYVGAVAVAYRS